MSNGVPSEQNPNRFTNLTSKSLLEQNQQLTPDDFENFAGLSVEAMQNALTTVFNGNSGILEGLGLSINNSNELFLNPGYGIVTVLNDNDPKFIDGTYVIVNNERTKILDVPLITEEMFVWLIHAETETDEQDRQFVKPDGTFETRRVFTRLVHDFDTIIEPIYPLPEKLFNRILLGTIQPGSSIPLIAEQKPLTLFQHSEKTPIDHPNGSIQSRHIDDLIMGDYQDGSDLNLRKMSRALINLQGNMASPDERISTVLDGSGNIENDAIETAVESLVQKHLGGLTDGQGNLAQKAVDNAKDDVGRPIIYKIGIKSGQVNGDNGRMAIPEGFTVSDCVFILSIGKLGWDQHRGSSVEIVCYEAAPGICQCYADVNGTGQKKYYGTANFIAIGIKPR